MSFQTLILAVAVFSSSAFAEFTNTRTDFKFLFNKYRFGEVQPQPWPASYWPYYGLVEVGKNKKKETENWGSGTNHRLTENGKSPAQKYDDCFGTKSVAWEEEEHTCVGIDKDEEEDCKAWYGHCNGWTGAGLYNLQPSYGKVYQPNCPTGKRVEFNYMDVQALMSELWMDVWASFEGTGMTEDPGPWIFHPNSKIAQETADNNSELNNYEAYWDVSPRQLFYILTNYVGMKKQGIAFDRYTGSEIWNQPLIGYRLLPILIAASEPEVIDGKELYPVTFGLKLYWANDEVPYDFKRGDSANWSITDPKFSTDVAPNPPTDPEQQDKSEDGAVKSRYISFILYFDKPVVSRDGVTIESAGKIKGDGLWLHAVESERATWYPRDYKNAQLHLDFIWRPDRLVTPPNFGNKYITPENLYGVIMGQNKTNIKKLLGEAK